MAAPSASLKEYLKKYQSATEDQSTKKKKKRKKEKYHPKPTAAGVLVVDEDPVWQKPILEDAEEEESGEELPQIDEDVEVKRMKRLEAIRSRKPYHMISNDGSGWVSVSDQAKNLNHANQDTDLSPPRQRRPRFDTPSPERERSADGARNDDLSPPRQRRRRFDTPSPDRGQKVEDSRSSKLSPRCQRRRRFDTPCTDSPERKVGEDLSPPRKRSTEDSSPPRRNRNRSPEADLSPPRRNRNRSPGTDLSPPRRRGKSSEVDLSPPRRNRNHLFEADLSPLRKGTLAADLSPPRRRKEVSLAKEGDLSSPRRRRELSLAKEENLPPPRRDREPSLAKEVRRTGLLSAEEIRKENEKRRREEISRFASMDPSVSGRGAQPIFRDKEGKRIKKEDLLKAQEAEEEKSKEKKLEWGKGLAQKREAEARAQELELEKDKPFARSRDDPELDKMLKERVRWGDPMAHLVKKNSETFLEDLGHDEKMKESGFIIPQTIPSHSWIKRGIDFPPNRYGIRPGRHWDGVDRSNGYEKELFKSQNEKRATEAEAYLWSVSDM